MRFLRAGEDGFRTYLLEMEGRGEEEGLLVDPDVRSILKAIKERGDKALLHYTERFDGVTLSRQEIRVARNEIRKAYHKIPQDFLNTLKKASHRIERFHRLQKERLFHAFDGMEIREEGGRLGQVIRPLDRVGIYVPGGKAAYPSTVLMAAIPARVAGVQEILMVTPPRAEGINPSVLVAADLAGVDQIYRIGGVQAIAALAYGTVSVPKVDKIIGPGNRFVAAAKRLVFGVVDIDMVAGPSEILIISDEKTHPSYVAADLISQAEHDEMALAILITPSERFGKSVLEAVEKQLASLERRKIAEASLSRKGAVLIVKDLRQAVEVANRIAPEHLELAVSNPISLLKRVKHAGSVFVGRHTPEAMGDYMAGCNHILPTAGTARFFSPLGAEDFIKRTNVIRFTRSALRPFDRDMKRFTEWEGLKGHYKAFQLRLKRTRM